MSILQVFFRSVNAVIKVSNIFKKTVLHLHQNQKKILIKNVQNEEVKADTISNYCLGCVILANTAEYPSLQTPQKVCRYFL